MNCKNMVVAGFNSGTGLLNQYLTAISESFNNLNADKTHKLIITSQDQFAKTVLQHPKNVGVCIGGSGVPQCAQLNKINKIRAAVVNTKYLAEMCRKHNDANVIIIASDCIAEKLAAALVRDYLCGGFDNQERNMIRINKLSQLEEKQHLKQAKIGHQQDSKDKEHNPNTKL